MGRVKHWSLRSKKGLADEEKPKVKKEVETYVVSFYLPEEIIVNILRKIPVEYLLRFRSVSKQWLSLISQITTRVQKVLIVNEQPSYGNDSHLWLQSLDQNTLVEDKEYIPRVGDARVCGSCNGLLLIGCGEDLFLWNPSTRCCISHLTSCYRYDMSLIGLCFDSDNDEYKVVGDLGDNEDVSVASFKTNIWMRVGFWYDHLSVQLGPVLNNNPHWLCGESRSNPVVCYFDSKNDVFIELPVPSSDLQKHKYVVWGLGVLDGYLCMTRTDETTEVLVMKEYGVRESWTTLFKFKWDRTSLLNCTPLFFTNKKQCEVLMLLRSEDSEDKIVSFDIDTNVFKEIAVGNLRNRFFEDERWEFLVYEETVIEPTWRRNAFSVLTEDDEKETE